MITELPAAFEPQRRGDAENGARGVDAVDRAMRDPRWEIGWSLQTCRPVGYIVFDEQGERIGGGATAAEACQSALQHAEADAAAVAAETAEDFRAVQAERDEARAQLGALRERVARLEDRTRRVQTLLGGMESRLYFARKTLDEQPAGQASGH